jgi:hypothetical protein
MGRGSLTEDVEGHVPLRIVRKNRAHKHMSVTLLS